MLRPATPADTPALIDLVIAAGMFADDEVGPLREVLDGLHAAGPDAEHHLEVWADGPGGPPVGVVYLAPDAMADRKWDLWMIAVAPDRQGRGIGGELIRSAEAHVRSAGGRLLLIDTSSLRKYDPARAFYGKNGYVEVARIPDYYKDGDGKVVFAKRLVAVDGGGRG